MNRKRTPTQIAIYHLRDPRTQRPRYVGQSDGPRRRLRQHILHPSGELVGIWIAELKADGLEPIMDIIEWVSPDMANEREQLEAIRLRLRGERLLNATATYEYTSTMSEVIEHLGNLFTPS